MPFIILSHQSHAKSFYYFTGTKQSIHLILNEDELSHYLRTLILHNNGIPQCPPMDIPHPPHLLAYCHTPEWTNPSLGQILQSLELSWRREEAREARREREPLGEMKGESKEHGKRYAQIGKSMQFPCLETLRPWETYVLIWMLGDMMGEKGKVTLMGSLSTYT